MRRRSWGGRAGALLLLVSATLGLLASAPADAQTSTVPASVAQTSLGWGSTTMVHASGFKPNARVRVILYAGGQVLADAPAASDGTFSAQITIPSGIASSNKYVLTVQGQAVDGTYGYTALPITVVGPTPALSISDRELSWNEVAVVHGERYQPGTPLSISLFPDNKVLAEGAARADGTFDIEIRTPDRLRSSDDFYLAVAGQGIDYLFHFDSLQITIIGDRPFVDLDRAAVPRGGTVRVSGQLFLTGTKATITLLPGFEVLATIEVDEDNRFTVDVTIPKDAFARDPHAIVVTGYGADGIFAYDSTAVTLDAVASSTAGQPGPTLPLTDPARPTVDRFVDGLLREGAPPQRPDRSNLAIYVLLLMLALLFVLILSTRRRRR
jgi:hypothetical protein